MIADPDIFMAFAERGFSQLFDSVRPVARSRMRMEFAADISRRYQHRQPALRCQLDLVAALTQLRLYEAQTALRVYFRFGSPGRLKPAELAQMFRRSGRCNERLTPFFGSRSPNPQRVPVDRVHSALSCVELSTAAPPPQHELPQNRREIIRFYVNRNLSNHFDPSPVITRRLCAF